MNDYEEPRLGDDRLSGGPLRAALSNAMVRIMTEFYGRGPTRAKTYMFDNYVFCVLDEVLTTSEKTLQAGGKGDLVREIRITFEDLMTKTFVSEVERLVGRKVVGYHSQVMFDPDLACEFFILEAADDAKANSGATETPAVHDATLASPGKVGDADSLGTTDEPGVHQPDVVQPAPSARQVETKQIEMGSRRAAISSAMVRLTHEHHGRGATRAKTYMADDYVFCALEEVLTTVEKTLVEGGQSLLVRRVRMEFMDLTAPDFIRELEQLTDRRVLSCRSQIVFDPDVLFLMFTLAPATGRTGALADGAADIESRAP